VLRDIENRPAEIAQNVSGPDATPNDEPLKMPVTAENLASLRQMMEQKIHHLDNESQQYFQKFANAAQRFVTACDLLSNENADLLVVKQNDEKKSIASSSTVVGKGHVMSYEDILEIQKQRQEQDVGGLKRKPSSSVSWRQKKSRVQGVQTAEREIQASGMEAFCSVF
jgi:hypothetical protein